MVKLAKSTKPQKPYPSFCLTAHNNGQWCKKIRGKVHFFGVWADPQAALDQYRRVAADLHAGKQPQMSTLSPDGVTVKDVCNHYLTHQLHKVESDAIGGRWLEDCRRVVTVFAQFVGSQRLVSDLRPQDFEKCRFQLSKKGLGGKKGMGVHALNRAITVIKGVFKYAYENDLIDNSVKYGSGFDKPSASLKRKTRQAADLQNGKRLFGADEILKMLEQADVALRAMILLGINGGMGNTDCDRLPTAAVDLEKGVIEFDRPKTGIERVVPLWPETIAALRGTLAARPKPQDEAAAKLVFVTTFGRPWVRQNVHGTEGNGIVKVVPMEAIGEEFSKLLRKLGLKRRGVSFYTLRHTFRTWADEVRDQHAIHRIMGHTIPIPGMSGIYVEAIGLDRLVAVTEHVRKKLFGKPVAATTEASGPASIT
jgi:integrase